MTTATAVLTGSNNAPPSGGTGTSGSGTPSGGTNGLPAAANTGWWDTVQDAEVKGWLASKKYPDAESALKAHWGLERLFGADKAGRTVMLPKDDNDAAGWAELSKKMGVPDTADGYKLPLPEGVDDGFAKAAAQAFHKNGIPPRAANAMAEWWNGWVAEQVKAGEAADRAESERQMQGLQKEWGKDYDANVELAQRGYRQFAERFGLTDTAKLERLESVIGAANLQRFFSGIGRLAGEDSFAGSDKPGGFGVSVADAQKRINEITADRAAGKISDLQWRKEAMPEMERLGRVIAASAS